MTSSPESAPGQEDLRVGVIGFGQRGPLARHAHRPGQGSRVVAVADPSERGRADARESLGEDIATYESAQDLIESTPLDAVMILAPDFAHAEIARQTLAAGIPTFTEKPLAIRIEDADEMLELALRTGTRLYVGHNMRHMPVIRQMKEIIDAGRIGRVRAIWCRHFVGSGGDFYFKDWHAERAKATSLLLQKGAHDIDVIHWLAGAYTRRVAGMGDLMVYGDITDRRDNSQRRMPEWYDEETWPPTAQRELNPVIDVEDISQLTMQLESGVLATYQQCHFTPDYWRNYTVIGDAGRLENMGMAAGDQIHVWTSRHGGPGRPDAVEVIRRSPGGHGGADPSLVAEFLRFARDGGRTEVSTIAAREAVATGVCGAQSIRSGGAAIDVPPVRDELRAYFDAGQR